MKVVVDEDEFWPYIAETPSRCFVREIDVTPEFYERWQRVDAEWREIQNALGLLIEKAPKLRERPT